MESFHTVYLKILQARLVLEKMQWFLLVVLWLKPPLVAKEPTTFYYLTLEAIVLESRGLYTRARLLKRVTLLSTQGHP